MSPWSGSSDLVNRALWEDFGRQAIEFAIRLFSVSHIVQGPSQGWSRVLKHREPFGIKRFGVIGQSRNPIKRGRVSESVQFFGLSFLEMTHGHSGRRTEE